VKPVCCLACRRVLKSLAAFGQHYIHAHGITLKFEYHWVSPELTTAKYRAIRQAHYKREKEQR